jgi:hypothetical protein
VTDPASTPTRPAAEVRIAFWNTWLLAPRLWRTGPRTPGLAGWFAPDVDERAPLVAKAVAGRFDVVALSECFERSEQEAVARAWPGATLADPTAASDSRAAAHALVAPTWWSSAACHRSGGDLRDSDVRARGAQLVAIAGGTSRPWRSSRHLIAGGDLFGCRRRRRHHRARMRQVEELVSFIEAEHDPAPCWWSATST